MSEQKKKGKRANNAASKTGTEAPLRADDAMQEILELREKLRRMEAILEGTRAGTWEWNVQTGETVFDERWADILGYTLAELAPVSIKTWEALAHPEDLQRSGELLARHFAGELPWYDCDCRMRHKSGHWVWVQDHGKVTSRTPDGQPLWMSGTHIDITSRKRAEEALRESEEKLRLLYENANQAISMLDETGRFLMMNHAAARQLRGQPQDFIGRTLTDVLHREDALNGLARVKEVFRTGQGYTGEAAAQLYGETRWFHIGIQPFHDGSGKITAVVSLNTDITERKRAEDALKESEERYRNIFDNAIEGIFQTTTAGRYRTINPSFARMFGYGSPEEMISAVTNIGEQLYVNPEDRLRLIEQMSAKGEKLTNFEVELLRKDRSRFWVSINAAMVRDVENGAPFIEGTCSDITERKRAEDEIRIARDQYQSLVSNIPGITYRCKLDKDWTMLFMSDAVDPLSGYPASDFIGNAVRTYESVIHPDDTEYVAKSVDSAVAEGRQWDIEYRICHKDGDIRWVREKGRGVPGTDGSVVYLDGFILDTTEQRRAEEALKESEAKYRDLVESSQDAIFSVDRNGFYQFANSNFASTLGHTPEYFDGKSFWDIYPKDLADMRHEAALKVFETGQPSEVEVVVPLPDRTLYYLAKTNPVKDTHGNIIQVLVTATDITDRKAAEQEKETLQAQLAQAQKMESVGRLAGGVAHDFNNMLSIILGHTELALGQVDPAQPLFADLQEVRTAAQRSADLTRQLLAFARKQTVAPRVIDLNETVSGMLKMLQRLIGEDIDLAWLPGKDPVPVNVDPSQIDQILANLCVNARDAIAGVGKLTIETGEAAFDEAYCAAHAGFAPGDYVLLAVSDNGCGMDAGTLGHLFEPFFTTKELGRGTGLGLAMVYGAVKQNNGFINVYSEPGQGTTFKIYLPRHLAKADRPAEKKPDQPAGRGHETILLVEDEPMILDMVTTMLESFGYAVIGAKTPGEAISLAREHAGEINLLMTDVVMPEMNGRDLAGNILSLYPGIKRLFMSGYTADVIAHHGILDEGVSFIQKPFSMKNLASKVREVLGE